MYLFYTGRVCSAINALAEGHDTPESWHYAPQTPIGHHCSTLNPNQFKLPTQLCYFVLMMMSMFLPRFSSIKILHWLHMCEWSTQAAHHIRQTCSCYWRLENPMPSVALGGRLLNEEWRFGNSYKLLDDVMNDPQMHLRGVDAPCTVFTRFCSLFKVLAVIIIRGRLRYQLIYNGNGSVIC